MEKNYRPGDSDQITRDYFDALLLRFRHIGAKLPDTHLKLFRETFDTPIMMAALSHLDRCRPHGTAEMAKGAKMANAVNWVGISEDEEVKRICDTGARTIKIIKPFKDEDLIYHRIRVAEECGCLAVGMDFEHAYTRSGEPCVIGGLEMAGKDFDQLCSYVKATKLPFILKGVLHPDDVKMCVQAGVAGIVVSHHHAIQDYAVPPLMALPDIKEAAEDKLKIFVDCGLNNGYDAFKALALGADGVLCARAIVGEYIKNGSEACSMKILQMTAELKGAMANTGSKDLKNINKDCIVKL